MLRPLLLSLLPLAALMALKTCPCWKNLTWKLTRAPLPLMSMTVPWLCGAISKFGRTVRSGQFRSLIFAQQSIPAPAEVGGGLSGAFAH